MTKLKTYDIISTEKRKGFDKMITITDRTKEAVMRFRDIEIGELFKYHSSVYLKIRDEYLNVTNAFDICDAEPSIFCEDTFVQAVNATITIEHW